MLSRYGWCSNLTQEIVDFPPKSSLLKAHTDSDGRTGCIRDSKIPKHQEQKIDESCETNEKHINVNEALCSDVNESKALGAADDVKVILGSIFSINFCHRIFMFPWIGWAECTLFTFILVE